MVTEANIKENGLVISDIWSIDVDDLKKIVPDSKGFLIVIDLSIGIENVKGMDDFRFTLVDKNGFLKYILEVDNCFIDNGIASIKNYNLLVIDDYTYPKLENGLRQILKSIDVTDNWLYIASQLNQYFYWEYENEFRSKL